ncbi:MAG: YfhO family protein, partial [Bacteroidetes bacterium]|nr:YfhO family protein [Bacteroidota bacterium]
MKINKDFLKQAGVFLLFLIGFWLISVIFLLPATDDKALQQGDMQQVRLMVDAANKYTEATEIKPNWNDRLFSGMPANLITGIPTGNLMLKLRPMELFQLVKGPYNFLFVAMLSMFVLLLSCNVNRWLSAAGAIGYAFMTFSISSYEAGHITKVLATDVMPGMLAGLVLITRRKYLLGAGVLGIFFAMLVGYFHYQIAYYAGIVAGIYLLIEMIMALKAGEIKHATIATTLSVVMLGMGAATNIGKAIDTARYSEATMRGGSAVASEVPTKDGPKNQVGRKGLDIDYAFSWSYGIDESMTLLIPGFMGGSSNERISNEDFDQAMKDVQDEGTAIEIEKLYAKRGYRAPLYHGDLQFTSGPVYIGAVFIFLFLLAIVAVLRYLTADATDSKDKAIARTLFFFSVATVLVSLMLGWGRYLGLNEWLFNHLPYYNKFRTPMMALVIAQMIIPFFGLYGLQLLLSDRFGENDKKQVWKVPVVAISALMAVAALMFFSEDFKGNDDREIMSQIKQEAMRDGQDEGAAIETAKEYVKQIVDMRSG